MRFFHAALAVAAIVAVAAAISVGGHRLAQDDVRIETDLPQDLPPADDADTTDDPASAPAEASIQPPPATPSRAIDPELIEPRDAGAAGALERVAPRPPLGGSALADLPKPKAAPDDKSGKERESEDWKGEPLLLPVASAAGEIESKGHSVTISGIDIVRPEEICTDAAGKDWACGVRARTAFRAFLRGRAVVCDAMSGNAGRNSAQCSIGKQDIGQWLVENGWARAEAGGPYADAGEKARAAGKGIFAPAPNLSNLPPEPSVTVAPLPDDGPSSILDLSGTGATPQSAPDVTPQVFPPAPVR